MKRTVSAVLLGVTVLFSSTASGQVDLRLPSETTDEQVAVDLKGLSTLIPTYQAGTPR